MKHRRQRVLTLLVSGTGAFLTSAYYFKHNIYTSGDLVIPLIFNNLTALNFIGESYPFICSISLFIFLLLQLLSDFLNIEERILLMMPLIIHRTKSYGRYRFRLEIMKCITLYGIVFSSFVLFLCLARFFYPNLSISFSYMHIFLWFVHLIGALYFIYQLVIVHNLISKRKSNYFPVILMILLILTDLTLGTHLMTWSPTITTTLNAITLYAILDITLFLFISHKIKTGDCLV